MPLDDAKRADLAAGFQQAVVESLIDRTKRAIHAARDSHPDLTALVVAGGVAANQALRTELEACAANAGLRFLAPPLKLCTDKRRDDRLGRAGAIPVGRTGQYGTSPRVPAGHWTRPRPRLIGAGGEGVTLQ